MANKQFGNILSGLRKQSGYTQQQVADMLGLKNKSTLGSWEVGKSEPDGFTFIRLMKLYNVGNIYAAFDETETKLVDDAILFSDPNITALDSDDIVHFPVIGNIAAGYGREAVAEYIDDYEAIPRDMLKGRKPDDFFVLRVQGKSMYPMFLDGDRVLVLRCQTVDSGTVAVVLYNDTDATLKKIRYGKGYVDLVPINPEYSTKRLEGFDLEGFYVLGRVVKLLRDV